MKNHMTSASGVIERFAADCAWASARLRRKPLERQQWLAGVADFMLKEQSGVAHRRRPEVRAPPAIRS